MGAMTTIKRFWVLASLMFYALVGGLASSAALEAVQGGAINHAHPVMSMVESVPSTFGHAIEVLRDVAASPREEALNAVGAANQWGHEAAGYVARSRMNEWAAYFIACLAASLALFVVHKMTLSSVLRGFRHLHKRWGLRFLYRLEIAVVPRLAVVAAMGGVVWHPVFHGLQWNPILIALAFLHVLVAPMVVAMWLSSRRSAGNPMLYRTSMDGGAQRYSYLGETAPFERFRHEWQQSLQASLGRKAQIRKRPAGL